MVILNSYILESDCTLLFLGFLLFWKGFPTQSYQKIFYILFLHF